MTTGRPTAAQYLDAYTTLRQRLDRVLSGADGSEPVPSCPGWTTRDVLAHLVGLCDDWNIHRLDGYATPSWTKDQITRYANDDIAGLLRRWEQVADDFAHLDSDPIMGPPARWAFGDAIIHEADLRGALEAGRAPHEAVLLSLEGTIVRWRALLNEMDPPLTFVVRTSDGPEWNVGQPTDEPATIASPTTYELFRALAGRRTEQQVRAWRWSHDPEPILSQGLPFPFRWATTPNTD